MRSAYARSNELGKVYMTLSMFILVLWWGYPIVWGLAEGSNTISIKAEARSRNTVFILLLEAGALATLHTSISAEAEALNRGPHLGTGSTSACSGVIASCLESAPLPAQVCLAQHAAGMLHAHAMAVTPGRGNRVPWHMACYAPHDRCISG